MSGKRSKNHMDVSTYTSRWRLDAGLDIIDDNVTLMTVLY